eukprot:11207356-Lingulodinium_polyedra.AAC.1
MSLISDVRARRSAHSARCCCCLPVLLLNLESARARYYSDYPPCEQFLHSCRLHNGWLRCRCCSSFCALPMETAAPRPCCCCRY